MNCFSFYNSMNRRSMLARSAPGFKVGLAAMAGQSALQAGSSSMGNMDQLPHFAASAKRVIFLFMWGGPSRGSVRLHTSRV